MVKDKNRPKRLSSSSVSTNMFQRRVFDVRKRCMNGHDRVSAGSFQGARYQSACTFCGALGIPFPAADDE